MGRVMPSVAQTPSISALVGIGLRGEHEQVVLDRLPKIGWLEVHSENYFGAGGRPAMQLQRIREHYPVSLHGIGLGLGNTDELDRMHLQKLRCLVDAIDPMLVSEHLCWNAYGGRHFSDLLPLPYTQAAAAHVASRIDAVQQALGRQILMENVSAYVEFQDAELSEWAFLIEVVHRAGCGILLDVNNVYVNACNHGYDPRCFLDEIPGSAVGEIHVAGHARREANGHALLIDTHDRAVSPAVWDLYARLIARIGPKPTLLERDANLPPLETLIGEARIAERLLVQRLDAGARA
jgi:uncharacterized protein (UPF0276 family)